MEIHNKIDTYLMGRMSEEELMSFENEMASNPDLQAEVNFQKDIVSALQDTKRLQLKQRLSSLETPATNSFSFKPWAIGASLLSLSVLGGIGIWEMNKEKEISPTIEQTELITTTSTKVEKNNVVAIEEKPIVETIINNDIADNNISIDKTVEKITTTENLVVTKPTIADPSHLVPNPVGIDDTENIRNAGHENESTNSLDNQEDTHINASLTPIVKQNKDMFHYQYDGEKLTLIGNFKSDTYTVYELTQQKGSPLYLMFKNSFYSLENNQGKTKKLELVTDQKILSELKSK